MDIRDLLHLSALFADADLGNGEFSVSTPHYPPGNISPKLHRYLLDTRRNFSPEFCFGKRHDMAGLLDTIREEYNNIAQTMYKEMPFRAPNLYITCALNKTSEFLEIDGEGFILLDYYQQIMLLNYIFASFLTSRSMNTTYDALGKDMGAYLTLVDNLWEEQRKKHPGITRQQIVDALENKDRQEYTKPFISKCFADTLFCKSYYNAAVCYSTVYADQNTVTVYLSEDNFNPDILTDMSGSVYRFMLLHELVHCLVHRNIYPSAYITQTVEYIKRSGMPEIEERLWRHIQATNSKLMAHAEKQLKKRPLPTASGTNGCWPTCRSIHGSGICL